MDIGRLGNLGQRQTGLPCLLKAFTPSNASLLKLALAPLHFGLSAAHLFQGFLLGVVRHDQQPIRQVRGQNLKPPVRIGCEATHPCLMSGQSRSGSPAGSSFVSVIREGQSSAIRSSSWRLKTTLGRPSASMTTIWEPTTCTATLGEAESSQKPLSTKVRPTRQFQPQSTISRPIGKR